MHLHPSPAKPVLARSPGAFATIHTCAEQLENDPWQLERAMRYLWRGDVEQARHFLAGHLESLATASVLRGYAG